MSSRPAGADPLAVLEAQQREEAPSPAADFACEFGRVCIPADGSLPRSAALLERLYRGELVAREKKELVVDTRRCLGPYMVSIDDSPLSVMDACSQIATLTHGFRNPWIVDAIHRGRFGTTLWSNPDTTVAVCPAVEAYREALRAIAPVGLEHVCFVAAGGAEANEKAMRMARMHAPNPQAQRVLAFRHGFHGRTFAALMATWNPSKREPFELPGYEAVFVDPQLGSVEQALERERDQIYAVIVEPMMAEGGDIHLSRDFLAGLRTLTRAFGLPLIVDEVQTGFHTGGEFLWWHGLGLGRDRDTSPDLLTMAKKAQLGVVLSRWPDPEPAPIHVASAIRGHVQLEHAHEQVLLEAMLRDRVAALVKQFPRVQNIRVAGTTFAFELDDAAAAKRFIDQRFARGFMTYPAGERTIRFRLNASFGPRELDDLFARIATTMLRLDDPTAAAWGGEGERNAACIHSHGEIDIEPVQPEDWPSITAIETAVYEAARRTPESVLRAATRRGTALVARDTDSRAILGFCFVAPLEDFAEVDGPRQDANLGHGNSVYSLDLTVSEAARGRGIGRRLKRAQIEWARERGFRFLCGRNKIGATEAMAAINRSFGAIVLSHHARQYDGVSEAEYYRIPLQAAPVPEHSLELDLASGIQAPFGPAPRFMASRELIGPTASKLNLSNYATLDTVHYYEHLRCMLPRGTEHLYTTTSRDETVDKALRCLKLTRKRATTAIGLEGGYVGHTTAAARSLSDPIGFGDHLGMFAWPRLPHPALHGVDRTVSELHGIVAERGSDAILGLVIEVVGERSGLVFAGEAASTLAATCRQLDIPLVLVETASGTYRSGPHPWGSDALPEVVVPDLVLWYPGGQLGQIFVGARHWVGTPLTLISTWDGDELSIIRVHEHLRAARLVDHADASGRLESVLQSLATHPVVARIGGRGLYRTLTLRSAALALRVLDQCRGRGMRVGAGAPDTLVLAPALDVDAAALESHLREVLVPAVEQCA